MSALAPSPDAPLVFTEFADVYNRYFRALYIRAFRVVKDDATARDITQDTMLGALERWPTYTHARDTPWPWLLTIFRRQLIMYYRRLRCGTERGTSSIVPTAPTDDAKVSPFSAVPSRERPPLVTAALRDDTAKALLLMDALAPDAAALVGGLARSIPYAVLMEDGGIGSPLTARSRACRAHRWMLRNFGASVVRPAPVIDAYSDATADAVFGYMENTGRSMSAACNHLGVSRKGFGRWLSGQPHLRARLDAVCATQPRRRGQPPRHN